MAPTLRILVEVDADPTLTAEECRRLVAILAEELKTYKANHPYSPVMFQLPRNGAIRDFARQAAEMAGMDVVSEPASRKRGCHYVIGISRAPRSEHAVVNSDDEHDVADLDPDMPLEVIHIVAAHHRTGEPAVQSRASQTAADKQAESVLKRIDAFNRDATIAGSRVTGNSVAPLADISATELDSRSLRLAKYFSIADTLALEYQRKARLAFTLIFSLGTLAAASYVLFLVFKLDDITLPLYLVLLVIAYGVYYFARKTHVHDRYIDYRGLAEGLRIQFYWSACGLAASAADNYPRRAGELDWIRQSIRSIVSSEPGDGQHAGAAGQPNRDMVRFWIANQTRYFETTLATAKRRLATSQWVIRGVFFAGLLGAALVLLESQFLNLSPYLPGGLFLLVHSMLLSLTPHLDWVKLVSLISPAVAAAIAGYVNKMGFKYQTKHYARMLAIYARAEARCRAATPKSLEALALSLGREALRENGEWASFLRERGIEAPASPFKKPWQ